MEIERLVQRLKDEGFRKSDISTIAKDYDLSIAQLTRAYEAYFLENLKEHIDIGTWSADTVNKLNEYIPEEKSQYFNFVRNTLSKLVTKSLYLSLKNGFANNINEIEFGVQTANAGDSAEFIFVARAILAGFNCSSVDVRSSRYDAIIDFNNKLLRVQVKGISSGNNISFKDRDRGGQGIDHTHESNRGQRITSDHCDIYVAVDKQIGICYIIPMAYADNLNDDEVTNINLNSIEEYRENWDVIKDLTS